MLKTTITEIVIHSDSDQAMIKDTTTVNIVDEGGGRFITITQYDYEFNEVIIRIDPKEVSILFKVINKLLNQ